ncbi:MAG: nucleoside-diphosphate sugar epimerase/dehydratase [Saccharospirillum sp.]|uniref:polysaccharide biosynthesis protein n=1 Tax=Saccharospirillum sp. TaxID=2033801 RepID=UPI003297C9B7
MRRKLQRRMVGLRRSHKKWIMVAADVVMIPFALWAAWALRLGQWWPQFYIERFWWLFPLMIPVGIFVFARLGLYRAIVRFMSGQAFMAIVKGSVFLALSLWSVAFLARFTGFPRSIPIIFGLVLFTLVGGSRILVRGFYQWLTRHYTNKEPVAIFGAGSAGAQLASALQKGREFIPVAFLDSNSALWKHTVQGMVVYSPNDLQTLITQFGVNRVLLAVPNATKKQRKAILDQLEPFSVHVQTTPSMPDIVSGKASVDQLQEVEPEDLLGRDPVPANAALFNACIHEKVVLVTGAGGSIGSELCRQVVKAGPTTLVLFEQSEFGLYQIESELKRNEHILFHGVQLVPLLGSVCNSHRIKEVFQRYQVDTVYHAAAYKHVPLVEHNVFEGIRNNVMGTRVVAEAAKKAGAGHFVLVSTDKAVRPTNVMGATKRMAELVVQSLAVEADTVFSMVRFGNVLGSSGSVVPLFREQIRRGGPVTVTHPDITRFFMTIPEAASLVVQAGAMGQGGDVFVLDMGKPVKIVDLARRMIELSGYDVKSEEHPEGDIEIEFSGLRPGEKLYEELLIGEAVSGTDHPKIMRANEELLPEATLHAYLESLIAAEQGQDALVARGILEKAVAGFKPSSPMVDLLSGVAEKAPGPGVEKQSFH